MSFLIEITTRLIFERMTERLAHDSEFLLLVGRTRASPRDGFVFGENIFCVLVPVEKLIVGSPVKLAVRKLVCGEGKMVCGESYPMEK